jgi:hypothetical protein
MGVLLLAAACTLPGSASGCHAQIDWVNFIEVGSTQYVVSAPASGGLQESDLGPIYTRVKFKVSGNICDPSYRLKDGDAAFLDVGTPIYQINGQPPAGELAARFNGRIVSYKAATPGPSASVWGWGIGITS